MNTQQTRGFTIVELLIVVVVIAILAAITIVSYNGITSRANNVAVQSDLGSGYTKVTSDMTLGSSNGDLTPTQLNADIKLSASSYQERPAGSALYAWTSEHQGRSHRVVIAGVSKSGQAYTYRDGNIKIQSSPWTEIEACHLDSYLGVMNGKFSVWNPSTGWTAINDECYY